MLCRRYMGYSFFIGFSSCGPAELLSQVSVLLADIPNICTPTASIECLPSVLYLLNGIIKYHCKSGKSQEIGERESFQRVIQSVRSILTSPLLSNDDFKADWVKLLRRFVTLHGSSCLSIRPVTTGAMPPLFIKTTKRLANYFVTRLLFASGPL